MDSSGGRMKKARTAWMSDENIRTDRADCGRKSLPL